MLFPGQAEGDAAEMGWCACQSWWDAEEGKWVLEGWKEKDHQWDFLLKWTSADVHSMSHLTHLGLQTPSTE